MDRILAIVGHPIAGSLNHALAERYAAGFRAAAGASSELRLVDLAGHAFELSPAERSAVRAPGGETGHLDPRVRDLVTDVEWAEHLVFFFPQWWGTYPAVLKAFLDRAILSGRAYASGRGPIATPLLTGRTARIVMTMDAPVLWNRFVYRSAAETSLKRATLAYCGIRTVGITRFTPVRFSTPAKRAAWLEQARRLGVADAVRRRVDRPKPAGPPTEPAQRIAR